MLKRLLRLLLRSILVVVALVLLYLGMAFMLSRIPVAGEGQVQAEIPVYLLSNGVHTDIVVPVHHPLADWERFVPASHSRGGDSTAQWVAFGWGDKGFYLETPTWNDLTARTAFRAAFALGGSAMHVTRHQQLEEGPDCKRFLMDETHYQRLVQGIEAGFRKGSDRPLPILIRTDAVYGTTDAFYEGTGRYNLFHTCNTWTNNVLKSAGQKACLWTPFDTGILRQYE
ncbi:MAG TPA: TIGR02117 family protein [Flavobacteriales bacterium]